MPNGPSLLAWENPLAQGLWAQHSKVYFPWHHEGTREKGETLETYAWLEFHSCGLQMPGDSSAAAGNIHFRYC